MTQALVIGAGVSGQGAKKLLEKLGAQITLVDRKEGEGVLSDKTHFPSFDFDLVVLSPGVPRSHPLCLEADRKSVEVIGEAELGLRHLQQPCLGVTGTNGKTTVVTLIAHLMQSAGRKARALGNVGNSLCEYVAEGGEDEVVILELSSFQLETLSSKKLIGAAISNITPDHMDRYTSFEEYRAAKMRIKSCVREGGFFFWGHDGLNSYLQLKEKGQYSELANGDFIGAENVGLALKICETLGLQIAELLQGLKSYAKPRHRIEFVRKVSGVSYFNDSKATTPESVNFALKSLPGNIHLIAGGSEKEISFESWKKSFPTKVAGLYLIGETADKIARTLEGLIPCVKCQSLEEALQRAREKAREGESVLLSPGCASFDMFRDYRHRGEMFENIVKGLT